ncbi:MAG: response regulator transcription factor [Armatimonadota bacterium]
MSRGKILVADSDNEAREHLAESLSANGYDVIRAASGAEAVRIAQLDCPDAVTIALEMPGMDGIETCREIRKTLFVPIVLIGDHSRESELMSGLDAGADYYVTRPLRTAQVLAYVGAAVRRELVYSRCRPATDTIRIKDLALDLAAHELSRNGQTIQLSPTEFRLLAALARNAGRMLTRQELLQSVWEITAAEDMHSRTVDVHIGRIRRKIGDDGSRQLYISTVRGWGYKMAL